MQSLSHLESFRPSPIVVISCCPYGDAFDMERCLLKELQSGVETCLNVKDVTFPNINIGAHQSTDIASCLGASNSSPPSKRARTGLTERIRHADIPVADPAPSQNLVLVETSEYSHAETSVRKELEECWQIDSTASVETEISHDSRNSLRVFIPIISTETLERLINIENDNEMKALFTVWSETLSLAAEPANHISIFPILMGRPTDCRGSSHGGNFCTNLVFNGRLSMVRWNGRCVQDVVHGLAEHLGFAAWDTTPIDMTRKRGADGQSIVPPSYEGGTMNGYCSAVRDHVLSRLVALCETQRTSEAPLYRVYLSFRQAGDMRDVVLANLLYSELWYRTWEGSAIQAFMGMPFRSLSFGACSTREMCAALRSAKVVVVVLSSNALAKLQDLRPTSDDTGLFLEWSIISAVPHKFPASNIIPIALGNEGESEKEVLPKLREQIERLDNDVRCAAVEKRVEKFCKEFCPPQTVDRTETDRTVKGIASFMLQILERDTKVRLVFGVDTFSRGIQAAPAMEACKRVIEKVMTALDGSQTAARPADAGYEGESSPAVAGVFAYQAASEEADTERKKLVGRMRDLKFGRSAVAARGLNAMLGLTDSDVTTILESQEQAIEKEVRGTTYRSEAERKQADQNLKYILQGRGQCTDDLPDHVRTCIAEGQYHGGELKEGDFDFGHAGYDLEDFVNHPASRAAGLSKAEVVALRLYTTSSFKHFNDPLRDETSPHPWQAAVYFLNEGLKKLRAVEATNDPQGFVQTKKLYRGMKNLRVDREHFRRVGGTELAPMSTTARLDVACSYAFGPSRQPDLASLILEFRTQGMNRGCSIAFLSCFPKEAEYLYPPLTFLTAEEQDSEEERWQDTKIGWKRWWSHVDITQAASSPLQAAHAPAPAPNISDVRLRVVPWFA